MMYYFVKSCSTDIEHTERMIMNQLPNRKKLTRPDPIVKNVNDLLDYIASYGDKVVYRYFENNKLREMTYIEFHRLSCQVSAAFTEMGFAGKRVAVIGDTSPQWLATYLGALAAGTIIVPMDILGSRQE